MLGQLWCPGPILRRCFACILHLEEFLAYTGACSMPAGLSAREHSCIRLIYKYWCWQRAWSSICTGACEGNAVFWKHLTILERNRLFFFFFFYHAAFCPARDLVLVIAKGSNPQPQLPGEGMEGLIPAVPASWVAVSLSRWQTSSAASLHNREHNQGGLRWWSSLNTVCSREHFVRPSARGAKHLQRL